MWQKTARRSIITYQESIAEMLYYFNGDVNKTAQWFGNANPLLGNISPNQMVEWGRIDKLVEFIKTQIDDNTRIYGRGTMTEDTTTIDLSTWSSETGLDPVSVGLILKILDSNSNIMYTINQMGDMNFRLLQALVKEVPEENDRCTDIDMDD